MTVLLPFEQEARACSRGRFACNREKAGVPPSQLVSTSFKAVAGAFIERWNSRIRGTISLRKREPLNTPK